MTNTAEMMDFLGIKEVHDSVIHNEQEALNARQVVDKMRELSERQKNLGLGNPTAKVEMLEKTAKALNGAVYLSKNFKKVDISGITRAENLNNGRRVNWNDLPKIVSMGCNSKFRGLSINATVERGTAIVNVEARAEFPFIPEAALNKAERIKAECPDVTFRLVWAPEWEEFPQRLQGDPALIAEAGESNYLVDIWGGDQALIEEFMTTV